MAFPRSQKMPWNAMSANLLDLVRYQLCAVVEAATVVDHIVPHRGDQKLFSRRSN